MTAILFAAIYKLWEKEHRWLVIGIVLVSLLILWKSVVNLLTYVVAFAILLCIYGLIVLFFSVISERKPRPYGPKDKDEDDYYWW